MARRFPTINKLSSMFSRYAKFNTPVHHVSLGYCQKFIPTTIPLKNTFCTCLVKDEDRINNSESTEDLISYGDKLLSEIRNFKDEDEIFVMKKELASILYLLYERDDSRLIPYFEKIKNKNVLTEAAYRILMRYYAEKKDIVNMECVLTILKEKNDVFVRCRSYIPCILALLRSGNFEKSCEYLTEMVLVMGTSFKSNNFTPIINTCTELRTFDNYDLMTQFVDQVFKVFEEFGSNELDESLVTAICAWFESDPKTKWNIEKTTLAKKHGFCSHCKRHMKSTKISPPHLKDLKQNLLIFVKAGIIKSEVIIKAPKSNRTRIRDEFYYRVISDAVNKKTSASKILQDVVIGYNHKTNRRIKYTFRTLNKLKDYINVRGPFDVVIDALNILNSSRHFNENYYSEDVAFAEFQDIVSVFVQQKRHILIIWADFLKSRLLNIEKNPADENLKEIFHYLQQHCSLFFVDSSLTDDLYVLYTLLHHNFNIQLVSHDFYHDHLSTVDVQNRADFLRWQKANQFFIESKDVGKYPSFYPRNDIHIAMQRLQSGWHIPVGEEMWYCISEKS